MRKKMIAVAAVLLIVAGCSSVANVTRFDTTEYPPTTKIDVFSEESNVHVPFTEIGIVRASRGGQQEQLDSMKVSAMRAGADALVKVQYDNVGKEAALVAQAVMLRYKH
ncbi:MAG TPA: hypothetical protein VEW28_02150 [Candidatus Kapabacteria bacterium]|nr:hypothetical protein [Candidatus Kapabacteria bacterium]